MRVLYNGWPLVEQPDGAPALHLLALLEHLPGEVQAVIALPGGGPAAAESWLPPGVEARRVRHPRSRYARLEWEQRILPGLLRMLGADLLHTTAGGMPLFGRAACLYSPAEPPGAQPPGAVPPGAVAPGVEGHPQGFFERLRIAASAGGESRLRGVLWPSDLPDPVGSGPGAPLYRLPPLLEPSSPRARADPAGNGAARSASRDLPETYVLGCVPPGEAGLSLVLDAWSWAAGPVGQNYPLLLVGVEGGEAAVTGATSVRGVEDTVRVLVPMAPGNLAKLVAEAAVLFHPGLLPAWGSLVRLALAQGTPVVAVQDPLCQAVVGPAAYLAPIGDARTLGAGILTVIVNEEVAGSLVAAGKQRAATWRSEEFSARLGEVYRQESAAK